MEICLVNFFVVVFVFVRKLTNVGGEPDSMQKKKLYVVNVGGTRQQLKA